MALSSSSTFTGSVSRGEPEPAGQPADVGVDRQPGQAEADAAHDVGRLAARRREGDEVVHRASGTSPPKRSTRACGHADQAPRLVPEEPGRLDERLDLGGVGGGQVRGRRVAGEQRGRDHVHPLVGGLGRQDRRRQQLERVVVCCRAHSSLAVPGYSSARRAHVSRARPFGVRGRATAGRRYRHGRRTYGRRARLEIKRQMDAGDIAAVSRAARRGRGRRRPSRRSASTSGSTWSTAGAHDFAGLVAWEPGHDHPVGYAQVTAGRRTSWALEFVIDPHHRTRRCAIGPSCSDAALDVVRAEGGGHVHLWVPKPTRGPRRDGRRRSACSRGRDLLPAAPPPPGRRAVPTSTTRPFVPGRRRGGVARGQQPGLRLAPRAGRLGRSSTLQAREGEPWFDPEGSSCTSATAGWPGSAGPRSTPTTTRRWARST